METGHRDARFCGGRFSNCTARHSMLVMWAVPGRLVSRSEDQQAVSERAARANGLAELRGAGGFCEGRNRPPGRQRWLRVPQAERLGLA